MMQSERRIRSLKLRGRDNAQLTQARYLLEEAFRTASLPGLPPNAMVLIRRLDLGAIRPGLSAVQLADTISATVRTLAAEAVCIDQQSGNDAGVVWFSDPLQPYQVLLRRLLDGREADEWYWRSLFPDQMLSLNEQVITELMVKACQTPVKGLAAALLIQGCLAPLRLSKLLSLLTPLMARRLLHEQGMSLVSVSGAAVQTSQQQVTINFQTKLERLIDAPDFSLAWRSAIQTAVESWGHHDIRCRWLALQALVCHRPAYLEHSDTWHRIELTRWLEAWSATRSDLNIEQNNSTEPVMRLHDIDSEKSHMPVVMDSSVRSFEPQALPLRQETFESVQACVQTDVAQASESDVGNNKSRVEWQDHFSNHAGFVFLIPLLQRLGMADLLQHHGALLALDFQRQLLWMMARRFGLDENDLCWHLFDDLDATPDAVIEQFDAPVQWWRLMGTSKCPQRYFPLQAKTLRLDQLIDSFQLVSALFLRRYCGLSLRSLIQRPGRIAVSGTHWDVMFDINQTDLRLRRVALDSDPGWVPWLGRVVQFHYDREG